MHSQKLVMGQLEALDAEDPGRERPAPAGVLPTGVVTFLLTDVEDSTRLWEADADAMAAALEVHDGLIASLVAGHGGRLLKDKGEGDSTLSVLERASDAVACAAQLQRAVASTPWPAGLELRVRVAMHSGEAQERDGDYFGPVVNRAARLRSLARGGVTVLSQSTAELVRDHLPQDLALVDVGRHELRGLSRAERIFELRAAADASPAGSTGPVTLPLARSLRASARSMFVGRDMELARLHELWAGVCDGDRSGILIGGEPGIGKTRLASELAHAVHEQGALVLYGRCDEGLAVPYQPFVEALRPYVRTVGLDRLRAELGRLAPELGRLLPELAVLGEPVRADPESERFALFEAVAALIESMTREQRAVLVLDDLHWAATPTLLLLRHLIRSERPLGVLLLGTYRDTELDVGGQLAQLLADLHRDTSAQCMSVRGLDDRAIAALVEETVGQALDERAELARVLGAQTAGNPFFLRELLTQLAESDERVIAAMTAATLKAPEGLRHVIRHRIARLSGPAEHALNVAAVAGATFSFVLLERVLDERPGALDALDEAVAAGLLIEAGHGVYAFAHALVRETIYEDLGSARRMRLHRQLGETLETLGHIAQHVDALAHHFAHAAADGQSVKAADYALAAGRSATARLGYEDAAAHYERGLEALTLAGQPQEERCCELLLALGEARWSAGELSKARQGYGQAAELAEKRDDATALAQAALGFCGPHRFEMAPAVTGPVASMLQRALAALHDEDSALRAQLMGRMAAAVAFRDVEHRRPLLARQALQMARRLADKATLADVLASHWATHGPDTLDESIGLAEELGHVADEIGDSRLRTLAHARLIDYLLELGDIDGVQRELDALQRLARTRSERTFKWVLGVFEANHAHLEGRLEDCATLARDAFAHRFEGHDEPAARIFMVQQAVSVGSDQFVETYESFARQYPEIAAWRCALAHLYAKLDRRAQARQELDALARAEFRDLPRDAHWLVSLSVLCETVVLLDDAPRAELLYELLLPYADRCVVIFALLCHGSASRSLGLLATTLSRYDEGEQHFEQALTMNARIKAPLWIACTQHDYACMLLLRNRPGDGDKALELLTEALAAADQLGMKALGEKARLRKLAAEAAAARPALPRFA